MFVSSRMSGQLQWDAQIEYNVEVRNTSVASAPAAAYCPRVSLFAAVTAAEIKTSLCQQTQVTGMVWWRYQAWYWEHRVCIRGQGWVRVIIASYDRLFKYDSWYTVPIINDAEAPMSGMPARITTFRCEAITSNHIELIHFINRSKTNFQLTVFTANSQFKQKAATNANTN